MVHLQSGLIVIKEITDESEKKRIAKDVLGQLTEWFYKKAISEYCREVKDKLFYALFDDELFDDKKLVGFISIQFNNAHTAEIHVMGVLKKYQRQNAGKLLIERACRRLSQDGYKFLAVKTLGSSDNQKILDSTKRFYYKCGFVPLGVFEEIWGKKHPCLIMVRTIKSDRVKSKKRRRPRYESKEIIISQKKLPGQELKVTIRRDKGDRIAIIINKADYDNEIIDEMLHALKYRSSWITLEKRSFFAAIFSSTPKAIRSLRNAGFGVKEL